MDLLHFDNTGNVSNIPRKDLERIVTYPYFFSERLVARANTELNNRLTMEREGNRISDSELRNCM